MLPIWERGIFMRTLTLLGLLSVLLAVGIGCATPEERIVDYYLTAVRDGQDEIVAGVSLVSFPEEDIQSWEIVEFGPESTEPYRLIEIRDAHFNAREAYDAKTAENDEFLAANERNALRYQQKMKDDPDYKYASGVLAEFQEVWEQKLETQKELQNEVKEAHEALERERSRIRMSTSIPLKNSFKGNVAIKRAKVNVNSGSGGKTYTLVLRKYNIVDSDTGLSPVAKWIITDIEKS
jgi:hypothetical protein